MATLILSTAGQIVGGPIGSAVGAVIGGYIDAELFGPPDREGPRLTELKVTTSSYGTPIPRHFGKVRAAGSIIWATDLQETREKEGGGKGAPATITYSYTSSFAVALASRPIASVRRIWADGNLLRGAAGDLKVGGTFRLYSGAGDEEPDPLIASAEGAQAPAFRGFAYCVFEELQLAEFGNRIPALTFEVVAENGAVSLLDLVQPAAPDATVSRPLASLEGFSDEGGALTNTLGTIDRLYPLAAQAGESVLEFADGNPDDVVVAVLPEPVVDISGDSFGGAQGRTDRSRAYDSDVPVGLRYYDIDRDYQTGMQRAGGQAKPGSSAILQFPGSLTAASAKALADDAARRAANSSERMAYRIAEIDPALRPGDVVAVPGKAGRWRIEAWEWRPSGVELELVRLPVRRGASATTASGRSLPQQDSLVTPTLLYGFELPGDGTGSSDQRWLYAAASSETDGWRGAALYAESAGSLDPIGGTGSRRSVIGTLASNLAPAFSNLIDRHTHANVTLASSDFVLESRTLEDLAGGANRALIGEEIVQFAHTEHLGGASWRLSALLRGRGGTEHSAQSGSLVGTPFVLLDDRLIALDASQLGTGGGIAAIGLADGDPVLSGITNAGISQRPLSPVHPRIEAHPDGGLTLCWTRRSRGQWRWDSTVDVPLGEQSERYEVGLGPPDAPLLAWETSEPALALSAATIAQMSAIHAGEQLWVRQIGTYARSLPLFLTTFA